MPRPNLSLNAGVSADDRLTATSALGSDYVSPPGSLDISIEGVSSRGDDRGVWPRSRVESDPMEQNGSRIKSLDPSADGGAERRDPLPMAVDREARPCVRACVRGEAESADDGGQQRDPF